MHNRNWATVENAPYLFRSRYGAYGGGRLRWRGSRSDSRWHYTSPPCSSCFLCTLFTRNLQRLLYRRNAPPQNLIRDSWLRMLAGDRYAGTGGQRWMGWAQDRSDISVIVNPPYPSLLFATVQKMRTIPFPSQYTSILSPGGISTISAGKISSVTQISGMTCLHSISCESCCRMSMLLILFNR